jgi:nucleoside-diphosphate-sugar epimerase
MLSDDRDLLCRVLESEKFRKKRFLITGATGFFGLNLLESLAVLNQKFNLDLKLTVLVRDQNRAEQLFLKYKIPTSFLRFLEADLLTINQVPFEHHAYDCIFHFAANTDAQTLRDHPEREKNAIIEGTNQILELAHRTKSKKFIYLSSGAVYGKQPSELSKMVESFSEKQGPLVSDVYGSAKVDAEQNCIQRCRLYGIKATILRGFAFGGPHLNLNAHYALGNLISAALKGDSIVVREGTTIRSYLYIIDAMIWILKAATSEHTSSIFNLGSDQTVTMEQLALKISAISGNKDVQILNRAEIPQAYVPNIDLAKKELGVDVYTSLDQIIHNMIEWNS